MIRAFATPALVALVLAACGVPDTAATSVASDEVRVGLTEWEVVASATAVSPGRLRVTVTNSGATAHDLHVAGAADGTVPVLAPGERRTVTVDVASAGALRLWCGLPGHRAQGMELVLPVSAGADVQGERLSATMAGS